MKECVRRLLTVVVCLWLGVSHADALSLKAYLKARENPEEHEKILTDLYIGGVGDGIYTANAQAWTQSGVALFCPPRHLVLHRSNYRQIVDAAIEKRQHFPLVKEPAEKTFIGLLLLWGLQDTFPCPTK